MEERKKKRKERKKKLVVGVMSNINSHHTPPLMEVLVKTLLEIPRKTSFRGWRKQYAPPHYD
jgi:hypothetical protein